PVTVGQHAHHAGAADAGLDRAPVLPQLPGDTPGGALLLAGQFGMLVQVFVESLLVSSEAVVSGQDLIDVAHIRPPSFALGARRTRCRPGMVPRVHCNRQRSTDHGSRRRVWPDVGARRLPFVALSASRTSGRPCGATPGRPLLSW